jgi:hypothetical protein
MKRSSQVTLTVVAAIGLAGCSRRYDPCDERFFDAMACTDAVARGGYYWHGSWVPMSYGHPYPYYYDAYRSRMAHGGAVSSAPAGTYAQPGQRFGTGGTAAPSSGSVTRGGFGSTGASHGSGGE